MDICLCSGFNFEKMKNKIVILMLFCCMALGVAAQNWQSTVDNIVANYCYREKDGKWYDAPTNGGTMSDMPKDNDIVLAYYWRIPEGKVKATIVWTNNYVRQAKMNIRLIRPTTGEVLAENSIGNTGISSQEHLDDLFGTVSFPADEFYRVEISSPDWSYVKNIKRFEFMRESDKPVLIPRNFGGTSPHMGDFASTDPYAPTGNAYDWAYVEGMVPQEYSYPGTFYMTLGTLSGYMGMQSVGKVGDDDFNRSVLMSVWDAANMDEDPNLPEYMQSGVMTGHPDAVHTHAGGEGSSASVMLKDQTKWWRPNKWVQFLQNTIPEAITVYGKTTDGRDTVFNYENTICSSFYKMHDESEWRYLATIRGSGINNLMPGWGAFMEPFTTYAGQFKHRSFLRHPAMRAANSGKWYSRNRVSYGDGVYDRDFHYDYGRGASEEYDNCFFFEMGGYGLQNDSAKTVALASDMTFVDTIDIARLESLIDASIKRDQRILFNTQADQTADNIPGSAWTPIAAHCTDASQVPKLLDGDENSAWVSGRGFPYTLAFEAKEEQTLTSLNFYWAYKYDYRCLYVDLQTSEDGSGWTTVFDSLEIRTGIDRPNVSFPEAVKTRFVKLRFYHPFTLNNLMFNELRFRGDYVPERILELARKNIEEAGTLNHYSKADVQELAEIYDNGNCTDYHALAQAFKRLAENGNYYKYGRVANKIHISSQRAYVLQNMNGHGTLCATANGHLSTLGATASGTLSQFQPVADISDPLCNWMILHDEHYSGYYLYNIGLGKWLNFSTDGLLADTPQSLDVKSYGKGFTFAAGSNAVGVNSTVEAGGIATNNSSVYSQFFVYDNYQMRQPIGVRDSLQLITEQLDKVVSYKNGFANMINAPVGVVGGFRSEAARDALQAAYDNADTNPQAFIQAVENADIVEFEPATTLYRVRSTDESNATPYLATANDQYLYCLTADNGPAQLWSFRPKNGGYTLHAQGMVLKPLGNTTGSQPLLTDDYSKSGTLVLSEKEWGKHFISRAQNYAPAIGAGSSPLRTVALTNQGATWYLEPCPTISVTMNSIGVSSFYADFAITLVDGLKAYVASYVTQDGVIKLCELTGTIPPRTPVLLRGDARQKYELQASVDAPAFEMHNAFGGVYTRTTTMDKNAIYTLATDGDKPVMKKPVISLVSANSIYIPYKDNMPALSTYTFDFNDLVDSVESAAAAESVDNNDAGSVYNLRGERVLHTQPGHIYIQRNRKVKK